MHLDDPERTVGDLHPTVRKELAAITARRHGGQKVGTYLDALVDEQSDRMWLLGLTPDIDGAVFYFATMHCLNEFEWPPDGGLGPARTSHERASSWRELQTVIEAREWGWLHPRWHWLFD